MPLLLSEGVCINLIPHTAIVNISSYVMEIIDKCKSMNFINALDRIFNAFPLFALIISIFADFHLLNRVLNNFVNKTRIC